MEADMDIRINAGNLWTTKYLNKVIELNSQYAPAVRVTSLFGSIKGLTPTARAQDRLPPFNMADLPKYIDNAIQHGISLRYTLNQSCLGSTQDFHTYWHSILRPAVQHLHDLGITEWTVTSALLCKLLRDMFPLDFIEISTIAEISNGGQARLWQQLGADGCCASTNINRNRTALIDLMEIPGFEVSLLANEACLLNCPFRRDCYNSSSHNSDRGDNLFENYPFGWCNNIRLQDPVEWLKSRMIAPQWMGLYVRKFHINNFKVAYRTHPYERAIPILESYMRQSFTGNYIELWPTIAHLGNTNEPAKSTCIDTSILDKVGYIEHFFDEDGGCDGNCPLCNYCSEVFEKASI